MSIYDHKENDQRRMVKFEKEGKKGWKGVINGN